MSRKDGKRVKNLSGMGQLIMDINPLRIGSEVYINQEVDVTNLVKYIEKKKKENEDITLFHAFITAIAKTIYNRKKLNYFIANRHLYEHNELVLSFVAKVEFNDKAEEIMLMVPIKENDNINTISEQVSKKVNKIRDKRQKKVDKKGANSAIDYIGKLPNIIRVPLVGILKKFDSYGWLPKSLCEDNLYYSSMIVTNLGSIDCGSIYHHLSDFGTCSSVVAIGNIEDREIIKDGKKEVRKMCDFGVTLDERIADGFYFIQAIKIIQKICDNPELLEEDANTKIEYDVRKK